MSSRKVMIVPSTVGLIKTTASEIIWIFQWKGTTASNLFSYATKANLKEATGVDTSN